MATAGYVNPRTGGNVSDEDLAAMGMKVPGATGSTSSSGYVNPRTGGNVSDADFVAQGGGIPGSTPAAGSGSSGGGSAPAPGIVQDPAATANPFKATGTPTSNSGQDTSGSFTPQDQSVESRIPGLLSTDNPIVQTQIGQAQMQGAARGLQNSTMTVEAGQKAAEASVLPIASQDAAQIAQQNLSRQSAGQTGALQQQQIAGTVQTTQMGITAQQQQQKAQIDAQNAQLAASLGSQANLQAAQLAAQKELQGETLTANEKMLVQQLDAAKANLTQQLNTTQQQNAQAATAQFAGIYQDAVNQINNNKDMTSEARTAALKAVQGQYNSNMMLVTQMFGVQLTWSTTSPTGDKVTTSAGPSGTNTTTTPAPPNTTVPQVNF